MPTLLLLRLLFCSRPYNGLHLHLNADSAENGKLLTRRHKTARNLRVPVQLLDALEVVHKQQLRRHVLDAGRVLALLVVQLHRQIPQRDRVVGRRDGDDGVVGGVPLDARHLLLVEVEAGQRLRLVGARGLPLAQVPHAPGAVVGAGAEQVRRLPRPRHDVDVVLGDLHRECGAARLGADVPDAHAAVGRARRKHRLLRGRPLQVLDARCVARKGSAVRHPAAAVAARRLVDEAVVVTRQELAVGVVGRPVDRVALRLVRADRRDGLVLRWRDGGARRVKRRQVRRHVVDEDVGRLGHGGRQRRRRAAGLGGRDLVRADAVSRRRQRDALGLEDGLNVLVIIVGVGLGAAVLVHLGEARKLDHKELVVVCLFVVGLRARHGIHGRRVRLAVVAQPVLDNVKREAGPRRRQVVQHLVGRRVGRQHLAGLELVAADDKGALVDFHGSGCGG